MKITELREKKADLGSILVGHKVYRKSHAVIAYLTSLQQVQAATVSLPLLWGNFTPRVLLQQLLYQLIKAGKTVDKNQEIALQEIAQFMLGQVEFIANSFQDLESVIAVDECNARLFQLHVLLIEANNACTAAYDALEYEAIGLNTNAIYMLKQSMESLEIAAEWVHAFIRAYSSDDQGEVLKRLRPELWDEAKIQSLNV
jgi:hypothetical protein